MIVVALTGGIASGKSTVARMFSELGAVIIDHDRLARSVVEPGKPAWRDIADWFGREVLNPDDTVNRAALASVVFTDPTRRKQLESFVHPRILREEEALTAEIGERDPHAVVVVDIPLLFEVGLNSRFSRIILAYAPADVQLRRLMARDGLSREGALNRLKAQMPIEEKVSRADYVINNNGSTAETRIQVAKVFEELVRIEAQ